VPKAHRVLIITGAGVSAESGIPTFRGKDGYWRNLDPAKLATPEAFARDPELVWEWYRERRQRIRSAQPNAAHQAISKLAQEVSEFLLITQNVDDLHARAGVAAQKIVQIHGDIFVTRCTRCAFSRRDASDDTAAQLEGFKSSSLTSANCDLLPTCPKCDALMRPGVVWFGEQLDPNKIDIVARFLARGGCDYVIIVGTTATFGYIIDWTLRARAANGGLVEVNPEETPLSQFATQLVREPAAVALPRIVDKLIGTSRAEL
jgi:NAD-dependent deacetylase